MHFIDMCHLLLVGLGISFYSKCQNSPFWDFRLPDPHLNCVLLGKGWAGRLRDRVAELCSVCLLEKKLPGCLLGTVLLIVILAREKTSVLPWLLVKDKEESTTGLQLNTEKPKT